MSRLWDKGVPLDPEVLAFTVGSDWELDRRLVPYDVRASIAHVRTLERAGCLDSAEAEELAAALEEAGKAFEQGGWTIRVEDEDGHTALENELARRLGPLGGKVHLGRSRNDQVLTAIRLYLKDACDAVESEVRQAIASLDALARRQGRIAIPGYTHGQQAMPSDVAMWAGGFATCLEEGLVPLRAARELADRCPLGSAAGYGAPGLGLDRSVAAAMLGFALVQEPATACQLSRGKAESALLFALAGLMGDLGRLAADVCLFASQEFGFVRLAPEISTGSSIMPHKRNPDVFELIRGRAAQAPADLLAAMAVAGQLPSGYHRDLQLIKEPLFRGIDRALETFRIAARAIGGIEFDAERAAAISTPGLASAERAFRIVQEEGIPFRDAYRRIAGELNLAESSSEG